eukprot:sb/3476830/
MMTSQESEYDGAQLHAQLEEAKRSEEFETQLQSLKDKLEEVRVDKSDPIEIVDEDKYQTLRRCSTQFKRSYIQIKQGSSNSNVNTCFNAIAIALKHVLTFEFELPCLICTLIL